MDDLDPVRRTSDMALTHGLSVTEALLALFITHPQPRELLAVYEGIAKEHDADDTYSQSSDEALDYAKSVREQLLAVLRDRVKR